MSMSSDWQRRQIAICLVMFLLVPFAAAATAVPQPAVAGQQPATEAAAQGQAQSSDSTTGKPTEDAAQSRGSQIAGDNQRADTIPSAPEQQQNSTSKPVGAAAAPYETTVGVAASRPAGAVVAPAKQKRARSFLIRVGLLVGAGVAIGTVIALSSGSPSRPN